MGLASFDPKVEYYTAPLRNWWDWPKLEPDPFSRFLTVLPEIAARLEAVETHLASGGKQPFVRAADRFGGEQLQQTLETISKRLERVEQQLTKAK
jgi:hypothetical protein